MFSCISTSLTIKCLGLSVNDEINRKTKTHDIFKASNFFCCKSRYEARQAMPVIPFISCSIEYMHVTESPNFELYNGIILSIQQTMKFKDKVKGKM